MSEWAMVVSMLGMLAFVAFIVWISDRKKSKSFPEEMNMPQWTWKKTTKTIKKDKKGE